MDFLGNKMYEFLEFIGQKWRFYISEHEWRHFAKNMNRMLILLFRYNETPPWNDKADIAILKVNEPFILNEWVAPVRLPKWNFTRDYSKYLSSFSGPCLLLVPLFLSIADIFSYPCHPFDYCSWANVNTGRLGSGMGKQLGIFSLISRKF